MKKYLFILLLPAAILTSCSTAEAETAANEFHQKLDNGDYDYICDNMIYADDLEESGGKEAWMAFFETVESWGPQKNRQQGAGFSNKINNGVSTSKLNYNFETDLGLVYESLVLVDRGEGFKLLIVSMNSDKSIVDNITQEY